jgi:hypothetical protein
MSEHLELQPGDVLRFRQHESDDPDVPLNDGLHGGDFNDRIVLAQLNDGRWLTCGMGTDYAYKNTRIVSQWYVDNFAKKLMRDEGPSHAAPTR